MYKTCQFCGQSNHIVSVVAKCSDLFHIEDNGKILEEIPEKIGRTDYIDFEYCAVCGKIQAK